jgi:hypothetical protein
MAQNKTQRSLPRAPRTGKLQKWNRTSGSTVRHTGGR